MKLTRTQPDKERAQALIRTAQNTIECLKSIQILLCNAILVREYYEALRELIAAIALMDGFTAEGKGAHLALIGYVERTYTQVDSKDIELLLSLRDARNKISYDGKFISPGLVLRKEEDIAALFGRLQSLAVSKTE